MFYATIIAKKYCSCIIFQQTVYHHDFLGSVVCIVGEIIAGQGNQLK